MSTIIYRVALLLCGAALATLPQEKDAALKLPKIQHQQVIAIGNPATSDATLADEVILSNLLEKLPLTPEQREDISARMGVESVVSLSDEARVLAKSNTDAGAAQLTRAEELIRAAESERTRASLDQAQEELNLVSFADTASAQARIDSLSVSLAEEERLAAERAAKAAEEKAAAEAAQSAQAAAAQQAQAQSQAASSGAKSFSDARAAFEQIVADYGIGASEKAMWEYIINREAGFNHYATNASSGAYGLPQSLPGSKMASAGADWQTNPYTQLKWMYGYMTNRYGSIAGAYNFWQANHWY